MKTQSFNVRVYKDARGNFRFDDGCFMHRWAKRGKIMEAVDGSRRDRENLKQQLMKGERK